MRDSEFGDHAYRGRFSFRKKIIFIPFLVAAGLALISYIVMLLWNTLLPEILHTPTITFWQALGLFVLAKILFGVGRGGGHRGGPWMHNRLERFKNMSPEEQQRFREEMRARCGRWGRHRRYPDWDETASNTAKPAEETPKPTE